MTSQARPDRLIHVVLAAALVSLSFIAVHPPARGAGWPPADLLVAEVVTGGASASDEFVEIYNAGSVERDLSGLELVYVTASGSTVSRKQLWTGLVLEPGRHLLVANSAGSWAPNADGLYTGGFAASGGSVVLRTVDGSVVDSLSWGDAASSFVEGVPAVAPPAGASVERLPGGASGNWADSNDNSADTHIEPSPIAQPLAADAVPAITPRPTFADTPPPSPGPACSSGAPDVGPPGTIAEARGLSLGTPVAVSGSLTTPMGLLHGGGSAFIEDATAGIAVSLTAGTWPAVEVGTLVTVSGLLESRFGLLTVQVTDVADVTIGAPQAAVEPLPVATGVACEPFEARLVSVEGWMLADAIETIDGLAAVVDDGSGPLSVLAAVGAGVPQGMLGAGSRLRLVGVLSQHDGTGAGATGYRLLLRQPGDVTPLDAPPTQAPTSDPTAPPPSTMAPAPTPTPTVSPSPSASPTPTRPPTPSPTPTRPPTPSPTPTPTPTVSPTATPTRTPVPTSTTTTIAAARAQAVGQTVRVRGTVTVAPGTILDDRTIAIQDATGGIFVELPDASIAGVSPGRVLEVSGSLAAPYGNLEIRAATNGVLLLEMSAPPQPRSLSAAALGESIEGQLVRLAVSVERVETSSSGSLTLTVADSSGESRVFFHAPLGASAADYAAGTRLSVVGLVADRLGLFRIWPRTLADVTVTGAPPTPTPRPSPTPRPTATLRATATPRPTTTPRQTATPTRRPTGSASARPSASPSGPASMPPAVGIVEAVRRVGQTATVEGIVTTKPGLLDADAGRVTIQDSTGAILVRLPSGSTASLNQRLRVTGTIGTYYGAPQITATQATTIGQSAATAMELRGAPIPAALEWRLVTISGNVTSVHRDGNAWRAELALANGSVPIVGLERSGIASTAIVAGRSARITGIVKRAYPTASDQRLAVVPRTVADIQLGGSAPAAPSASGSGEAGGAAGGAGSAGAGATPNPFGSPHGPAGGPAATGSGAPPRASGYAAIVDLDTAAGTVVTVGGRVAAVRDATVTLDDGTATVTVRLVGDAAPLAADLRLGDIVNATGAVQRDADGRVEIVVDNASRLVRLAPATGVAATAPSAAAAAPDALVEQRAHVGQNGPGVPSPVAAAAAILLAAATLIAVSLLIDSGRRTRLRARVDRAGALLRARLAGAAARIRSG